MATGRKPKLSVINDKRAHRSKNEMERRKEHEPTGCSADFVPPDEMSADARKEWTRLIKLYNELDARVLNDLDVAVLTAYCESVAIYRRAQKAYQSNALVGNVGGKVVESPYIRIMSREGQNIARYAEQLCLSPVGRARMGVAAAKKEVETDPMAAYFGKYGND